MSWILGPAICLLILGICWVAIINVWLDIKDRREADEALRRYNAERFQPTVHERIAELEHLMLFEMPHRDPDTAAACPVCRRRGAT